MRDLLDIPLPEGVYDRPDGQESMQVGQSGRSQIDQIRDLLNKHVHRDNETLHDLEANRI